MRRLRVTYRPEALADLQDIYDKVLWASRDATTADRFYARIRNRCSRIGDVPKGGRPREDLQPGLRMVPFEHSAVIAYRVEEDRVRILNIFYGGRDFEAFYLDGPHDGE